MTRCWGWRRPPNRPTVMLWASPSASVAFCVFLMECCSFAYVKRGRSEVVVITTQPLWPPQNSCSLNPRHHLRFTHTNHYHKSQNSRVWQGQTEASGLSSWPRVANGITSIEHFTQGMLRLYFCKIIEFHNRLWLRFRVSFGLLEKERFCQISSKT